MRSLLALLLLPLAALADGAKYSVSYPASDKPGELIFPTTYNLWLESGACRWTVRSASDWPIAVSRFRGVPNRSGLGVSYPWSWAQAQRRWPSGRIWTTMLSLIHI